MDRFIEAFASQKMTIALLRLAAILSALVFALAIHNGAGGHTGQAW